MAARGVPVHNAAVSDVETDLPFHITNNGQSSSLLEFGTHEASYPWCKVVETITVRTKQPVFLLICDLELHIRKMFGKWLHLVAMVLVIVGGLNWGSVGLFGLDLVRFVFGRSFLAKVVYIAVAVSAIILAVDRASYLPFLGETVMPCSILQERVPDHADTEISLHGQKPGAKILYWATEPATEGLARIVDWRRAYLDFANAGVTTVDAAGHATLRTRKPQPYTVPMKGRIEAHVHWRVCGDDGLLGPVQNTMLTGGPLSA